MGLSGRYWLTPDGLIPVSGSEHANIVKRRMLLLEPDQYTIYAPIQKTFDGIDEEDASIHRARGINERVLRFLLDRRDPRNWAMAEWGWVRTDGSTFNSWFFDDDTLNMVRARMDYWRMQEPNIEKHSKIDWNVMAANQIYRIDARTMLQPEVPATALLRLSEREKFMNPRGGLPLSPCCAQPLQAQDYHGDKWVCTGCQKVWDW